MSERLCYRCGRPGEIEQVDVTALGDAGRRYIERTWCATPGCTDPNGSRRLDAPTPAELQRRAEDAWLRFQRQLAAGLR